ncbi:MAG TPA: peptidoglycan-binding protein [Cyanobacteria bacterium UBA9273]|nr:peptidoglycan-binding protein [Cyanobacteria bacterium UBA9273]
MDGFYGKTTQLAVAKFQKSIGLAVDGVSGPTTRSRLQTAAAAKSKPAPKDTPKPETKGKKAGTPNSKKKLLFLLAGAGATLCAFGGGLFLLIKLLDSKKTVKPSSQLDKQDGASPGFTAKRLEPQSDLVDATNHGLETLADPIAPESYANGHNSSALTISSQNPAETPSDLQNSENNALVKKKSRHSKVNVVSALIKDLQDEDPQKRRKAIWELAQRGDSRAVQPLVDLMLDADSKQRSLILEALSQIGIKTLNPMNRALALSLQDGNPEVRKNAIRDLTLIYELVAQIVQMLNYATDDPDPEVQETARWAMSQLDRIRGPSTVNTLPPASSPLSFSENQRKEPPQ